MVVGLLILILLVLLFGAAAVRGWLSEVFALAGSGVVMLIVACWLISYLGDDGFIWLVASLPMIAIGLLLVGTAVQRRMLNAPSPRDEARQRAAGLEQKDRQAEELRREQSRQYGRVADWERRHGK